MPKAYVDSGVLIKLYVREPNSATAAAIVQAIPAVPLTPLHELEIRNTLSALVGSGAITQSQRAASEHTFDVDITAGRLHRTVPDWDAVFLRSRELAATHTAETLARSLDVLHVAMADLSTDVFVTADKRRAAIARRVGLEVRFVE
ncbi:MAG: type II toxin-antitoxin system VapC family toxin [Alkalispirochaeta sp.]